MDLIVFSVNMVTEFESVFSGSYEVVRSRKTRMREGKVGGGNSGSRVGELDRGAILSFTSVYTPGRVGRY